MGFWSDLFGGSQEHYVNETQHDDGTFDLELSSTYVEGSSVIFDSKQQAEDYLNCAVNYCENVTSQEQSSGGFWSKLFG